jgi:hypothetical protein
VFQIKIGGEKVGGRDRSQRMTKEDEVQGQTKQTACHLVMEKMLLVMERWRALLVAIKPSI